MSQFYLYKIHGEWIDLKVDNPEIIEIEESPVEYAKNHFHNYFHTVEENTTYQSGPDYFLGCIIDIVPGKLFKHEQHLVNSILIVDNKNKINDKVNQLKYLAGYLFMDWSKKRHSYMDKHNHYPESVPGTISHSLKLLREYTHLFK